jgi:transketolase
MRDGLKQMRKDILRAAFNAGEGHVASAFSILEVLDSIYSNFEIGGEGKDRFVLSKGHASLAIYAVLSKHGLIHDGWVEEFCEFNSAFGGHPDSLRVPEIAISSGSLGHGLPLAVGMALAKKAEAGEGHVIVLVGDGELNEGSNWESMLVANHHTLDNLQIVVDFNHSGDRAIALGNLSMKFESFGCDVVEVEGHDLDAISRAITRETNLVKVTIAHTVKGNGLQEMQNNPEWHHKAPDRAKFESFMEELT